MAGHTTVPLLAYVYPALSLFEQNLAFYFDLHPRLYISVHTSWGGQIRLPRLGLVNFHILSSENELHPIWFPAPFHELLILRTRFDFIRSALFNWSDTDNATA